MLTWAVCGVLAVILAFSVYKLADILIGYRNTDDTYRRIVDIAMPSATPAVPATAGETAPEATPTPEIIEAPITVDWAALKAVNEDIVAWLYCEGTVINYPVVLGDDNEFYLKRGVDRERVSGGSLFFDYRSRLGEDENLVIYGHRMNNDSMFGTLPEFADVEYYNEHPVMYLLTEEQDYLVVLFSCRTVRGDMEFFRRDFDNESDYRSYLSTAIRNSYWGTDGVADTASVTLTLVTCSSYTHVDNPRLLVHGRLVPIG